MENKILIINDCLVVRAGVAIILKQHIKNLNISNAENFIQAIEILKTSYFNLIFFGINIRGGKNLGMIEDLRAIQPDVKILIFSVFEEDQYACRYILSGANGYLNKSCSEKKIIEAVTIILENGKYISSEIANKIVEATLNKKTINPLDLLSKREFEITSLLVNGNGNLEIANKLNIQMSTVSTYKIRVYEKLKINNLVELIGVFKTHIY
ncbi:MULTISPECIES: response regulator transcription factor [Flavobacterium]|uniref:Response regulator transcription factor n=1 Tax=Flavobacterium ranwuense TaxID=2541725 RepID=A0ABY2DWP1_9FLAO|nr:MULTISPECIES: response regulator transcription factor [Flavobacterium]TDE31769.1 response regulator transcription factor [Flavobacterium ranwuense]TDE54941.1 response regulator transcription factor [Flavobacterium sp. GT3P67]